MNMPLTMMYGGRGTYSSLIFVAPALMLDLYQLSLAGDWAKTVPLMRRIADFYRDVLGPLFAEGYCDAALDKAMAEASGLLLGFGAPRPPYRGLSPRHYQEMRQTMLDSYPDFIYQVS
jgi:dihydrodipicolinate synthase/N-acetylneuraminate lyase